MRLTGPLSARSVETVRGAMVSLLIDAGCVVADLSGLELSQPASLSVFPAALADAGGWPRARLGLFGADAELLGHLRSQGVCEAVAVADTLDAVVAATSSRRPPRAGAPLVRDADATPPARGREGEALHGRPSPFSALTGARNDAELAVFVREQLGRLLDYDRAGGSELVPTLSVYLDHGGDYDTSAAALGIHRSTLRYRLHRIREISGHNLGEASTRFSLHVATSAWNSIHGPC
jgi:hypothetical protein